MKFACIDLEGVLIPEIWPFVASQSGIDELSLTTREYPDYKSLVNRRINILRKNRIDINCLRDMVSELTVFDGARKFLTSLSEEYKVIIVSDAFYQTVDFFLKDLGEYDIFCHKFDIDSDGFIFRSIFSRTNGKEEVIENLRKDASCKKIVSVGDAFNDLNMIRSSDMGVLFSPSRETKKHAKDIKIMYSYQDVIDVFCPSGKK